MFDFRILFYFMPIYEYKCSKCFAVFEVLVRGDEKPACPECGSKRLKKLVSSFGVGGEGSKKRGGHSCCGHSDCGGGGHSDGHCCCGGHCHHG